MIGGALGVNYHKIIHPDREPILGRLRITFQREEEQVNSNHRWRLTPVLAGVIISMLAATVILEAQKRSIAPSQNHVVLFGNNQSALQTALDSASSAGLRVLFGSHEGLFFSRDHAPESPVAYQAVREDNTDRLERALNAAGAQGFRLIAGTLFRAPRATVAILHRTSGASTRYRYRVLQANDVVEGNLRDVVVNGSSVVGVFTQQSGMAASVLGRPGRFYVVLENSSGDAASATVTLSGRQHRVVSTLRASTLEKELNQAAGAGYRMVGGSFMNVLLEKAADTPPDCSYRVIAAIRGTTLQYELAEAGRAGYRVVPPPMSNPNSQAETVIVMERTPGNASLYEYQYQWVAASRLADSNFTNGLSASRFGPVALWPFDLRVPDEFGDRPEASAHSYFVLWEKEAKAEPIDNPFGPKLLPMSPE